MVLGGHGLRRRVVAGRELGVVRRPLARVEQHLRGLVVGPEPAVTRVQVGDRGLPGSADLRVGGGAVDVEEVVEAGVHSGSLRSVSAASGFVGAHALLPGDRGEVVDQPLAPGLDQLHLDAERDRLGRHGLAVLALGEGIGEGARHQRGRGVLVHDRDAGGEDLGLSRDAGLRHELLGGDRLLVEGGRELGRDHFLDLLAVLRHPLLVIEEVRPERAGAEHELLGLRHHGLPLGLEVVGLAAPVGQEPDQHARGGEQRDHEHAEQGQPEGRGLGAFVGVAAARHSWVFIRGWRNSHFHDSSPSVRGANVPGVLNASVALLPHWTRSVAGS